MRDIPDDWATPLSLDDRTKLERMRQGLSLPDMPSLLVSILRWLVVGSNTAWLGKPLHTGLRYWLDNVAY